MALEGVGLQRTFAAFTAAGGAATALRNGQILNATISALTANGAVRLDTAAGSFEARLPAGFRPGATVQLQVQRTGSDISLLLLGAAKPASASATGTTAGSNLASALQAAVGAQNSIAPLLANLAAVMGGLDVKLPAAVHTALEQLVAFHLPADGSLDAEQLRTAILNSGLLYEAKLASGAPAQTVSADMKGVLLALQNALRGWLGAVPPGKLAGDRPAPPLKGPGTLQPGGSAMPADLSQMPPRDIGQVLLAQADAALARLRLAQIASLPGDGEAVARTEKPGHELTFELPFAVGEKTTMVQFKLSRETGRQGTDDEEAGGWSLRFSLDVDPLGPVHASVVLRNEKVSVTLWAESQTGLQILRGGLEALKQDLELPEMLTGDVQVLAGSPERRTPTAGAVLDRAT